MTVLAGVRRASGAFLRPAHVFPPLAVGGVLFLASFILFVNGLCRAEADVDPPVADGLVVFTGTASERIVRGIELLKRGKGERLLISGVLPGRTVDTIADTLSVDVRAVRDRIDLDYSATDTVGNALHSGLWADAHGYGSVILITSIHHMPRAFLEMQRSRPHLRVVAHRVVPKNVRIDDWTKHGATTALLMGEYARYLLALTTRLSAALNVVRTTYADLRSATAAPWR